MRAILLAAAMLLPLATAHADDQTGNNNGQHADPGTSRAKTRTTDIDPSATAHATIRFVDDGSSLTVVGQGSGFDPNLAFVSLIYADPSVARGALACIPPSPNPYSPSQMFVAYWTPTYPGSRERTLSVVKTGSAYVPLSSVDTVSIRYDSTPQVGNPAATTQTPARYWLQACGRV